MFLSFYPFCFFLFLWGKIQKYHYSNVVCVGAPNRRRKILNTYTVHLLLTYKYIYVCIELGRKKH